MSALISLLYQFRYICRSQRAGAHLHNCRSIHYLDALALLLYCHLSATVLHYVSRADRKLPLSHSQNINQLLTIEYFIWIYLSRLIGSPTIVKLLNTSPLKFNMLQQTHTEIVYQIIAEYEILCIVQMRVNI